MMSEQMYKFQQKNENYQKDPNGNFKTESHDI